MKYFKDMLSKLTSGQREKSMPPQMGIGQQKYVINHKGQPITEPKTYKQIVQDHGKVQNLEKDPEIRIVPHKPKSTPKPPPLPKLTKPMGKAQDIKIPKKDFFKEHKRLIDVLESPSHKDDVQEAKKQRKELQEELGKTNESEESPVGRWFHGTQKDPNAGLIPVPRVKYLGIKDGMHHFQKESGHIIKFHENELNPNNINLKEHLDQSDSSSEFMQPDYSDDSMNHRLNPEAHPQKGKTYTIKAKPASDMYRGSHIKISLHSPEGKDESYRLAGFQSGVRDIRNVGSHLSDTAKSLWDSYGIKVKLHPSAEKYVGAKTVTPNIKLLGKSELQISVYDNGDIDLEVGESVPQSTFDLIAESLEKKKKSFQFKAKHKSKKGGLTEAGRKAYNRATGSKLKRPQPGGGKRKKSFCARSKGQMKMHNISCSKTPDKRVCLARRRWACKSEGTLYFESLAKAKIIDFKTRKPLADLPSTQTAKVPRLSGSLTPDPDVDRPGSGEVTSESRPHKIKVGKKAYKAYVRHYGDGTYDVEIDHENPPAEAYDIGWDHFENLGYMSGHGFNEQGEPDLPTPSPETKKSEEYYRNLVKTELAKGKLCPEGKSYAKQWSKKHGKRYPSAVANLQGAKKCRKIGKPVGPSKG